MVRSISQSISLNDSLLNDNRGLTFLSSVCDKCAQGTTTLAEGTTSADNCTCAMGYTGTTIGSCTACSVGWYRDTVGTCACLECPDLTTTANTAETSKTACVCIAGAEPEASMPAEVPSRCRQCALGSNKPLCRIHKSMQLTQIPLRAHTSHCNYFRSSSCELTADS